MRNLISLALLLAFPAVAQTPPKTLAERLGYAPDAKLVMIHTDDLGMTHSVNAASIQALESGPVNSASIMVPTPWFPEIAAWARKHPEVDLGLHLTLTSEWTTYRWGPVSSKDRVPSLLDDTGYLHITEDVAAAKMKPSEAEAEVRAQIERAKAFGIPFTHFDSHMRTLLQNPALLESCCASGATTKCRWACGARSRRNRTSRRSSKKATSSSTGSRRSTRTSRPSKWADFYTNVIRNLKPGVTEIVVHTGYDHPEMRAATDDHPDWGSAWRQRELDFLTSDAFRALLREHNVKLITWREIGKLIPR